MKRMGRWLFNFAAGISLMLCVGMAILWVRSYWIADSVVFFPSSGLGQFTQLDQGQLRLAVVSVDKMLVVLQTAIISHETSTPGRSLLAPPMAWPWNGWLWHGFGLVWSTAADSQANKATRIGRLQQLLASLKQEQAPTTQQLQHINSVQTRIQDITAERPLLQYGAIIYTPAWLVVLLAGMLPGLWLCRFLTRIRHDASGLCLVCGYDLRATPDRCPECGTITAVAKGDAP